ncbi:MAG: sugar transferase [Flavobacteriales bacterium]|nr:sugar transferase [Flavobacteriales bacterium]
MIRVFDLLISLISLLVLSPFLIVIAILVKISSPGPILFVQKRVGKDSKDFRLYKFRTMRIDSEHAGQITIGRDPRITSIGLVLRKFKLDELPQLFNILKGEMSIVGPRPEVRKYVEMYTAEQRKILNVRPGLSDFASIKYANESEVLGQQSDPERYYIEVLMPDKIKENMKFLNDSSLKNYFKIIMLTIMQLGKG